MRYLTQEKYTSVCTIRGHTPSGTGTLGSHGKDNFKYSPLQKQCYSQHNINAPGMNFKPLQGVGLPPRRLR